MESIREVFIPENNKIVLTIPDTFIGKKIEVFATEVKKKEENSKERKKKTFDAIKLDLTGFKFNREEANER